jgi:hypothetical protein
MKEKFSLMRTSQVLMILCEWSHRYLVDSVPFHFLAIEPNFLQIISKVQFCGVLSRGLQEALPKLASSSAAF